MIITPAKPESEEDVNSFHTYISSVAGGMSAASFSIKSKADYEQRSQYSHQVLERKNSQDTAEKLKERIAEK